MPHFCNACSVNYRPQSHCVWNSDFKKAHFSSHSQLSTAKVHHKSLQGAFQMNIQWTLPVKPRGLWAWGERGKNKPLIKTEMRIQEVRSHYDESKKQWSDMGPELQNMAVLWATVNLLGCFVLWLKSIFVQGISPFQPHVYTWTD